MNYLWIYFEIKYKIYVKSYSVEFLEVGFLMLMLENGID